MADSWRQRWDAAHFKLPIRHGVKVERVTRSGSRYLIVDRYVVPMRGAVRPYVSGAAGIAHMSPQANFTLGGIQLESYLMQLVQQYPELEPAVQELQAAIKSTVNTTFREDTRPMAAVGGGLSVTVVRHLTFDLGYRYSAIFVERDYLQGTGDFSPHSHNRIDVHRVYAGVGVTF